MPVHGGWEDKMRPEKEAGEKEKQVGEVGDVLKQMQKVVQAAYANANDRLSPIGLKISL